MPDFGRFVERKLRQLDCELPHEVVEELAGHLSDCFEQQLRAGLSRRRALRAAIGEAGDWKELQSGIASARRSMMTDRAKRILIPGAAALLIATAGERFLWLTRLGTPNVFQYWSWLTTTIPMLFVLFIAGAAGAACSLQLGGNRRQRFWAMEFPALSAFALFLVLLVGHELSQTLRSQATDWGTVESAAFRYLVFGILIPAIALLVGGLPFLLMKVRDHGLESSVR